MNEYRSDEIVDSRNTEETKPSMPTNNSRYGNKSPFIHLFIVGPTVNHEEWFLNIGTRLLYIMSHNIT